MYRKRNVSGPIWTIGSVPVQALIVPSPGPLSTSVEAVTVVTLTCWPGVGVRVTSTQVPVVTTTALVVGSSPAVATVPPVFFQLPTMNDSGLNVPPV